MSFYYRECRDLGRWPHCVEVLQRDKSAISYYLPETDGFEKALEQARLDGSRPEPEWVKSAYARIRLEAMA